MAPKKKRNPLLSDDELRSLAYKARDKLNELARPSSLCHFALIEQMGDIQYYANRICFGVIRTNYKGPILNDAYKIAHFVDWGLCRFFKPPNGAKKPLLQWTDEQEEFLSWVVHDSIWSDAFITQDLEEIKTKGALYDTALPASFVIQAAIVLRELIEYPNVIKLWKLFYPYIGKMEAFIFSHYFYISDLPNATKYNTENVGWSVHSFTDLSTLGPIPAKRMIINDRSCWRGLNPMSVEPNYYPLIQPWWTDNKPLIGAPRFVFSGGNIIRKADTWGEYYEVRSFSLDNLAVDLPRFMKENFGE